MAIYGTMRFMSNATHLSFTCICFFSLLVSGELQAQMSGSMRGEFLGGYQTTCVRSQIALAKSSRLNFPVKIAEDYCACAATYIADSIDNTIAVAIYEGHLKLDPNLKKMASKYCRNDLERDKR